MKTTTLGGHAVVLGASMAGLLTPASSSETTCRSTSLIAGEYRRACTLHGLQPRGRRLLDELFPGFTEQAVHAGAERTDVLGGLQWQLSGQRLRAGPGQRGASRAPRQRQRGAHGGRRPGRRRHRPGLTHPGTATPAAVTD